MDSIVIRGAREHNLKNIDVVVPRNKFVVFTGVSGSGKSSLAFDTIFAEGQRRYVESLSAYARQFLEQMEKEGFTRAVVDGEMVELADPPTLDKQKKHSIDIVIDRLVVKEGIEQRLADSLETATRVAKGLVKILYAESKKEELLSQSYACPDCGISIGEITPRLFSFNSPHGACPRCSGLGVLLEIDETKITPDPTKSIEDGAIAIWKEGAENWRVRQIHTLARHYKFSLTTPWEKLPEKARNCILYGSPDKIRFEFQGSDSSYRYTGTYEGLVPMLQRRYHESDNDDIREEIERSMTPKKCPECGGRRLKPEALAVTVANQPIDMVVKLQLRNAEEFFKTISLTPATSRSPARF